MKVDEFECTAGRIYDARNQSVESIEKDFIKPYLEEILTYTVFALIVFVGLSANGLFIYVVYKVDKMRTVMNAYLVNLAVADMIILGYGYLDRLYFYVSTPLNFGTTLLGPLTCVASALFELTYYVSLFTVMMFSIERYTAVCHPLKHIKVSKASRTRFILISTWIISLFLALLQIPGKGRRLAICMLFPEESKYSHLSGDINYCGTIIPNYSSYVGVPIQILPFYTAMTVTACCYALIIKTLMKREKNMVGREESTHGTATAKRSRSSATRMIIINGCVFFLCNAPLQFFVTVTWCFEIIGYQTQLPNSYLRNIFLILTLMLYLNSTVNPFIYSATNRQYRMALLEAFSIKFREDGISGE